MSKEPISIVIPCFNEESCILEVISEVTEKLKAANQEHELIVIDDGSTDRTYELLKQSGMPDKVIHHRFNRGYGASIKAGIRAASHEYVLIMDADGQHPPDNLLLLLDEVDDYDMVIGARRRQASHHWRMPGKMVLKIVCEALVGTRIPDINSGFRILRKSEALNYMNLCSDRFSFSTSITLAFLSDRLSVKFVPVNVRPRQGGQSQVKIATGFSTFMLILRIIGTFNPLKIFIPPTIALFLVGMALLIQGLLESNVGDVAILCLISSMILFCFGLLADQLALLRREINKS